MFCKVLEEVIEFFGAAMTKKNRIFCPKMAKTKAIFWPKTVFLGPEWSVVGLPTLF